MQLLTPNVCRHLWWTSIMTHLVGLSWRMIPFMPSPKRVGMMYGESSGMTLHQEFHYKFISTWLVKIRSLLLMWWLLTQHGKQRLRMSLVNQQMQLQNLAPLLRPTNIEGFVRGTILFWWPWRCMTHPSMTFIISLRNMFVFSTIDDYKVIYPCFFAFNFSSNVLVLFFNVFQPLL
jgi:hypothetical protein